MKGKFGHFKTQQTESVALYGTLRVSEIRHNILSLTKVEL